MFEGLKPPESVEMWSTSCILGVLFQQRPNLCAIVWFKQTVQATSDLFYTPGSPPGFNRGYFLSFIISSMVANIWTNICWWGWWRGGVAEKAGSQPSTNGWRIQNHVATGRTVTLQSVLYFWCWPLPEAVSVLQSSSVILLLRLWNFPFHSGTLWQHFPHPRMGTINF